MTDEAALGRYPVTVQIPVAWGDMDALGHVNNAVYLRWFETGRIAYFERIQLFARKDGVGPILARQAIDYRLALRYPDTVRVAVTVARFGTTSFTMAFKITSGANNWAVAAEGEGIGVLVDYRGGGKKVPLDEAFKRAILDVEAGAQ